MKKLILILPVITLLLITSGLCAQPATSGPDETYGLDPLLYNGRFYTYHVPSEAEGTPYFNGSDFVPGSVKLREATFNNLSLKYDLYNQQLILQFLTSTGGVKHIVLSDAWMESFKLGNVYFEVHQKEDTLKHIFQVIGNGPIRALYSWRKDLDLDTRLGAHTFVFSKAKKEAFLQMGPDVLRYTDNKSFISHFDHGNQSVLKKHLNQQHITVKKASDQEMTELIQFCNTLSPK